MLAQARQIHHEGIFILSIDLLLDVLKVVVLGPLRELAAQDFLPVRAFLDLFHPLAGDLGPGACGGKGGHVGCRFQVVVVEIKRLIVVVDFRHVGVSEDIRQNPPLGALLGMQLTRFRPRPATVPALLVFPVGRITGAWLGFDVVEPSVFDAFAAGPDVLAGDRASVASDALVQVQHLADLCTNFHSAASTLRVAGVSSQSTFFILRTTTNSSRLLPTVP